MTERADLVRTLHRINGATSFAFGLAANVLLFALVTKSRLQAYKRLILQMGCVDFTYLIITFITDPIIVLVDGNEVMLQDGYFRQLPQPFNLIFLSAFAFGFYFTICSISIQFLFRYLVLCRQTKAGNGTLLAMLTVPMGLSVAMAVIYFNAFKYPPEEECFATRLLKDMLLETGATSVYPGAISRKGNPFLILLASCAVALMGTNYLIIAFCVWRISVTLKRMEPSLQPQTKLLNAQLSRTLFVQAISPLVVSIGPLTYLCWCIIAKRTAFLSMMVMTVGFSWIPFTNASVTIVIVKQFRVGVTECLKRCQRSLPSTSNTATVASTNASSMFSIFAYRTAPAHTEELYHEHQ